MADNWWEQQTKGSWLDPEEWKDEWKYLQFLASIYGDWLMALGFRGITSFGTPEIRTWWESLGKPSRASAEQRTEAASKGLGFLKSKTGEMPSESERIQELRDAMTPEGQLPYKGFEEWREYLEGRGFELVETDPLGKITEPFYRLKPEEKKEGVETDPLSEALLRLPLEQFKWQQGEAERARREAELERQGQQQWARMRSQSESLQRQQMPFQAEAIEQQTLRAMAEAWEAGKGASVSNDPRNWIQRYINERRPNPYREQLEQMRLSPLQERERALIESQGAAGQVIPGMFGEDIMNRGASSVTGQDTRIQWMAGQLAQREKAYKEELAATKERSKALDYITNPAKYQDLPLVKQQQMAALGMEVSTGGLEHWQVEAQQRAGQPATPEIPQWMSRMTGLSGNVPQKPTEIPTPSGQAWTGLTGSQRQQFAGLVDFASQVPFGDILDRMAMMQGGTPTGARYARVKPSRQWA